MLNRSFNGPDRGVPKSPNQKNPRTLGAVIKEKDEELALFFEMRKREKELQNSLLLNNTASDDLDHLPDSKPGNSPIFKIASSAPTRRTGAEDFLNSDNNKNDYDWLLTPPGTPLFPSLEKEAQRSPAGLVATPKARPTALKSRLADPQEVPARAGTVSRPGVGSTGMGMGPGGIRRPSSSGGPGTVSARPATPTGRLSQSVVSRPARSATPTSRSITNSSTKSAATMTTGTAARRSSTPTSRPGLSSSAPSSSIGGRSFPPARSSTPTRRASAGAALSGTPTRPSAPSTSSTSSSSSVSTVTAMGASRSTSTTAVTGKKSTGPLPTRGESPTVKSRPWKPSEMPGFSLDVPPNLRTTLPERPTSASRGRPGVARSASVDTAGSVTGNGVPRGRRQSCSPSRGRIPVANGSTSALSAAKMRNRSSANCGEDDGMSPVLIGSKMVERVVNLRRLAPPRRDERGSPSSSSSSSRSGAAAGGKPSSAPPESSGFGRNLSKKSLDMAMRHMDIRRSIPSSLRPLMTNVPASSMYSVRSGGMGRSRGSAMGVSDSPLATSSNASSSELSLVGNPRCLYASSEADDEAAKDGAGRSPAS